MDMPATAAPPLTEPDPLTRAAMPQLFLPEHRADPYGPAAQLRAAGPLHRTPLGLFLVTRYADCAAVLQGTAWSQADVDLVSGLTIPVPLTTICELISIPAADRAAFGRWAPQVTRGLDPDAVLSPAEIAALTRFAGDNVPPHLSFSHGPHFCLGGPRARLEADITIGRLARRAAGVTVLTDRPGYRPGISVRGLARLPVRLVASQ